MGIHLQILKLKKTTALFISAVVLLYTNVYGQSKANVLEDILKTDINETIKKSKVDSLLSTANPEELKELTFTTSIHFYYDQNYTKALLYGDLNLKSIHNAPQLDTLAYRRSLCNLGLFNYDNHSPEISENYYNQVLKGNINDTYQGRAAFWLGIIYQDYGDYYRALDYYEMAKNTYQQCLDQKGEINTAIKIAELYLDIEGESNIEKGKKLLLQILESKNIYSIQEIQLQNIHQVLAGLYNQEINGNPLKSEFHYLKALEIADKRNDEYASNGLYNNIGYLYLKYDLKKAYSYLSEGLNEADRHWVKAMFMHNLGVYYYKTGDLSKAIKHLELSIIKYLNLLEATNVNEVSISEFELSYFKSEILNAFIYLIDYENQNMDCIKDPKKVYQHISKAEMLIDFLRFESDNQESRLYWQEQASDLYHIATKTAFLNNDSKKAFYYMEQNKAVLLLKDITDREIKRNSRLPEALIIKEKTLKNNIYHLQDNYYEASIKIKDSIKTLLLQSKIAYQNFMDALKKDYPQYYGYKTPSKIVSLEQVQLAMLEDEIIIEYLLNRSDGYALFISKKSSRVFELCNVSELNRRISVFQSEIKQPFITGKDFDTFKENAFDLYNLLFPLEKPDDFIKNKRLTVIPDYSLFNIPFEALVTSEDHSLPNSYLIWNTEINYAYSLSFLNQNNDIPRTTHIDFIGFAPVSFRYDPTLSTLKYSQQEVLSVKDLFSGKTYLEGKATKEQFLKNSQYAEIIHLSTHADATDSITPWIAFKDKKLTLNELYTTKNNADLVVVSACNSALGKLNEGEGIMSLARGFFNAGAKSVISSLWNVDDRSGQYINTAFYENLKKGTSKSQSLHQAKKEYLKNHSLSELSPYYWSSLILIGDSSPIKNSGFTSYLFIGPILLLIVLIFTYRFKR